MKYVWRGIYIGLLGLPLLIRAPVVAEKAEGKKPPLLQHAVRLQVSAVDSVLLDSAEIKKLFADYFNSQEIPIDSRSPLLLRAEIYAVETTPVSKMAGDLVRMELKTHVRLFKRGSDEFEYAFDMYCRSVVEGFENAQREALKTMRMDSRELDLLSVKIKALWGDEFY